jgi:hypothetical protein
VPKLVASVKPSTRPIAATGRSGWARSNTVQLWGLPLLMVGQNVLARTAVRQAQETHDAVLEDRDLIREELQLLRAERDQLAALTTALIPAPAPKEV